jgi:hypothetical protein
LILVFTDSRIHRLNACIFCDGNHHLCRKHLWLLDLWGLPCGAGDYISVVLVFWSHWYLLALGTAPWMLEIRHHFAFHQILKMLNIWTNKAGPHTMTYNRLYITIFLNSVLLFFVHYMAAFWIDSAALDENFQENGLPLGFQIRPFEWYWTTKDERNRQKMLKKMLLAIWTCFARLIIHFLNKVTNELSESAVSGVDFWIIALPYTGIPKR